MSFKFEEIIGLKLFSKAFAEYKDDYVIIGGIAATYAIQTAGLNPRATEDIDLVIYSNPNVSLANKLSRFIASGKYQNGQKVEDRKANNYRFFKPEDASYPKQIEIFSTNPFSIDLPDDQQFVPIPTDNNYKSLSAILMDDDYIKLVKDHIILSKEIPLLDTAALICLKIAAYLDLVERKTQGKTVDSRDINKHRNDAFILSIILDEAAVIIPDSINVRINEFIQSPEIRSFDQSQLNQILRARGITGQRCEDILRKIETCFL